MLRSLFLQSLRSTGLSLLHSALIGGVLVVLCLLAVSCWNPVLAAPAPVFAPVSRSVVSPAPARVPAVKSAPHPCGVGEDWRVSRARSGRVVACTIRRMRRVSK